LLQTYPDKELVIINDCPEEVIVFDHPNVKVINTPDRFPTIGDKRNACIAACSGDVIVRLDDDDILLPGYLEFYASRLQKYDWVFPQRSLVFNKELQKIQITPGPNYATFVFKKSVWDKIKYPSLNHYEDGRLWELVRNDKMFSGVFSAVKLDESGYIYGWDEKMRFSYQLTPIALPIINQNSNFNLSDVDSLKTIDTLGQVDELIVSANRTFKLNPHWNLDYQKLARDFVSTNSSVLANVPQIRSADATIIMQQWLSVKHLWQQARDFYRAAASRGLMATATHAAGINDTVGKRVSSEAYERRRTACFGDATHPACNVLMKYPNGSAFCGACGCGTNPLAELSDSENSGAYTKLHYPELKCPMNRF